MTRTAYADGSRDLIVGDIKLSRSKKSFILQIGHGLHQFSCYIRVRELEMVNNETITKCPIRGRYMFEGLLKRYPKETDQSLEEWIE